MKNLLKSIFQLKKRFSSFLLTESSALWFPKKNCLITDALLFVNESIRKIVEKNETVGAAFLISRMLRIQFIQKTSGETEKPKF